MSKKISSIDNDGNIIGEDMMDTNYEVTEADLHTNDDYDSSYKDKSKKSKKHEEEEEEFDVFGNQEEKKPFNKMLIIIPVAILILILLIVWIVSVMGNRYTVDTAPITIKIKETAVIEVKAKEKVKKKITFSSEDEKIATVDKNGTVTGVSVGNTTIYVGVNGKKSKKVNVQVKTNKEELEFKETNIRVEKGKTYQLEIKTVLEEDIFTWTSANENIATVDQYGVVTGVHGGTTTISATESDGRKVSTRVTVLSDEILIEKITIDDKTIAVGEELILITTIEPEEALGILTWKSTNEKVVTVDEKTGLITGIADGSATITVESHNGIRDTARITVDSSLPASIEITGCKNTLRIDEKMNLDVIFNPDITTSDITWSSSDTDIAKVSDGVVTGKDVGKVVITAETDNKKVATCEIDVTPMLIETLEASTYDVTMDQGDSKKVSISFTPYDAEDYYTLTWKSSNTKIATVDQTGKITGVSPGTTYVTASAGGKTAKIKVTILSVEVTSIKLTGCKTSLEGGKSFTITAQAIPTTAKNRTISWSSSNTSVATVSAGKVTGVGVGKATITASTANGVKSTCVVQVTKPKLTSLEFPTKSITVKVNGSTTITATTNLSSSIFGKFYDASWTTANPDLIKIEPSTTNELSAKITGLKKGQTTLYVIAGGDTAFVQVIVE